MAQTPWQRTGVARKVVSKYLEHYAEVVSTSGELPVGAWGRVVVVPVFAESADFILGSELAAQAAYQAGEGKTLTIVVLNAPRGVTVAERRSCAELAAGLGGYLSGVSEAVSGGRLFRGRERDVLLIERWREGAELDAKGGVGLARKIGSDVAVRLFFEGRVQDPWLYWTDADAELSRDHFLHGASHDCTALIFPFSHCLAGPSDITDATWRYEATLRYRVLGMHWAGSPYAFHALGSALAVQYGAYCAARGAPKRAAGEDFYILQKLSKLGPVQCLSELPGAPKVLVRLRPRLSARVPFGTGPAAARILEGESLCVDSPRAFAALKELLRWLDWGLASVPDSARPVPRLPSDSVDELLGGMLQDWGLAQRWAEARATPDSESARERLATWFDGLKQQQVLHQLRAVYAGLPVDRAGGRAPFISRPLPVSPAAICRSLAEQEARLPPRRGPRARAFSSTRRG